MRDLDFMIDAIEENRRNNGGSWRDWTMPSASTPEGAYGKFEYSDEFLNEAARRLLRIIISEEGHPITIERCLHAMHLLEWGYV